MEKNQKCWLCKKIIKGEWAYNGHYFCMKCKMKDTKKRIENLKKAMLNKDAKKRISYNNWINSQLSVVKYSGICKINGVDYILDYKNCKTKGEGKDKKYFPDLVEK